MGLLLQILADKHIYFDYRMTFMWLETAQSAHEHYWLNSMWHANY